MTAQPRRLVLVAQPLPECDLCAEPTRRDVYDAQGGLCSRCNDGVQQVADSITPDNVRDVAPAFLWLTPCAVCGSQDLCEHGDDL